jgi:hypothetical protein
LSVKCCQSKITLPFRSSGSSELFKRRKFKKHLKHKYKKKKSKKKKKKILLKFAIGFIAFLAIKFALEKLWYIFPTVSHSTFSLSLAVL